MAAAAAVVILSRGVGAGEALVVEPDAQFALAQSLYAAGDFQGAVVEYRRFAHFFPEDPRVEAAMYAVGRSWFDAQRFNQAIEAFLALVERFPDSPLAVPATLAAADAHQRNAAPGQAVALLERLAAEGGDPRVIDEANYRIGWIHLEAADWDRARQAFDRIRPESREAYRLRQLSEELERVPDLAEKNPAVAGLLALIPGAGHVYCGRYRDALIAFTVNAALIAAAVESFDNDLPVLGGVISAVGLGFYSGSIYSAVGSAHKHNRSLQRDYIEGLKAGTRPVLTIGPAPGGMTAILLIPF